MEITIRNARPEDMETLTALLAELFAIEEDFSIDKTRQCRGLSLMLDGCGKHRCIKVAETKDRRVVGMVAAQLVVSTAEGALSAWIEDVVVNAQWRGRRIGPRLLEAATLWAEAAGATRLQLLADRDNAAAFAFYRKQGWQGTHLICLRKGTAH